MTGAAAPHDERKYDMFKTSLGQREAMLKFAQKLTVAAAASTDDDDFEQVCRKFGLDPDGVKAIWPVVMELGGAVDWAVDGRMPWAGDWQLNLLHDIADGDDAMEAAIDTSRRDCRERLENCIDAIPAWDQYAALAHAYTAQWPRIPRHARPDDPSDPADVAIMDPAALVKRALAHLKDEARRNYVFFGRHDMWGHFGEDTVDYLRDCHVYVMADLDRFTEKDLGFLPAATYGVMGEISRYRERVRREREGTDG